MLLPHYKEMERTMRKISSLIRKVTIPPVFAALLLGAVYVAYPHYFSSVWQLIGGIFFLSVLPTLAYPLQKYIPRFKERGREGQRTLAMLFSFAGYVLGALTAFATNAPLQLKIIFIEYLLCGVSMLLFNKAFRLKASGHACGVVGPVILLLYFKLFVPAIIGVVFIIPVYIASLRTKQHTAPQLLGGSVIPAAALALILFAVQVI